jgi:hypothetical protein
VALALAADKFLMKVADVSNFIAPCMILLTFFQTVSTQHQSPPAKWKSSCLNDMARPVAFQLALLLKFSMDWPESLQDLMKKLSVFNINLELARCFALQLPTNS